MPTKRDNKKTALDNYVERFEKIADKLAPKPIDYTQFTKPEPVRFDIKKTSEVNTLASELMVVLNGHTLQEIIAASNIVEQYVKAQSNGLIMSSGTSFPY